MLSAQPALQRRTKSAPFKEFLSTFCKWLFKASLHRLKFEAVLHTTWDCDCRHWHYGCRGWRAEHETLSGSFLRRSGVSRMKYRVVVGRWGARMFRRFICDHVIRRRGWARCRAWTLHARLRHPVSQKRRERISGSIQMVVKRQLGRRKMLWLHNIRAFACIKTVEQLFFKASPE